MPASATHGVYAPHVYGAAVIRFGNKKRKIDEARRLAVTVAVTPSTRTLDWEAAAPTDVMPAQLLREPPVAAPYLPLPAGAMDVKVFTRWAKQFDRWLARTQRLEVPPQPDTPDVTAIGPKRGGVSVDLVAIVWVLG
jgi:hypothetical protein